MTTTEPRGPTLTTRGLARRSVLCFIGLLGVAAALTVLFFSMRAVMEIGGSCASGNVPYAVTRPCPSGVPGLMVGSIFLGLAFLGLYAFTAVGPNLTLLAWPALFLSLGWNFLDFGVNPPDGSDGVVWGWLLCGVIFVLMGGVPLIVGIRAAMNGRQTRAMRARAGLVDRYSRSDAPRLDAPAVRRFGLVLQLVAIVVGIWAGIEVFEWGSGSTVTITFG
jgi:hypothetical protein